MLEAARWGGEWAWSRLYREFAPPVLRYLRLRGAAEPEDLLGEVFLQVACRIGSFSGDAVGLRNWLFTIAHRRVIDEHRARSRRPVEPVADLELPSLEADPAGLVADRLAEAEVVGMLDGLTPDQRDVLLLRLIGGFTVDEVALIVDNTAGGVKALQRRGLAALKKSLSEGVTL